VNRARWHLQLARKGRQLDRLTLAGETFEHVQASGYCGNGHAGTSSDLNTVFDFKMEYVSKSVGLPVDEGRVPVGPHFARRLKYARAVGKGTTELRRVAIEKLGGWPE